MCEHCGRREVRVRSWVAYGLDWRAVRAWAVQSRCDVGTLVAFAERELLREPEPIALSGGPWLSAELKARAIRYAWAKRQAWEVGRAGYLRIKLRAARCERLYSELEGALIATAGDWWRAVRLLPLCARAELRLCQALGRACVPVASWGHCELWSSERGRELARLSGIVLAELSAGAVPGLVGVPKLVRAA